MRTDQAIREFLTSRIAANLSPAITEWYKDSLLPFAMSCPTLPRRPEPLECFLAEKDAAAWNTGDQWLPILPLASQLWRYHIAEDARVSFLHSADSLGGVNELLPCGDSLSLG
jgi:hypothetical protein